MDGQVPNVDIRLTVCRAEGFWARLKGLMFVSSIDPGVGLWIGSCRGIHTFFMRFPIDVIFLSRELKVLKLCPQVRPGRFGPYCAAASSVLECEAGFIVRTGLTMDHRLEMESAGTGARFKAC